jgi:hypothetical protein
VVGNRPLSYGPRWSQNRVERAKAKGGRQSYSEISARLKDARLLQRGELSAIGLILLQNSVRELIESITDKI